MLGQGQSIVSPGRLLAHRHIVAHTRNVEAGTCQHGADARRPANWNDVTAAATFCCCKDAPASPLTSSTSRTRTHSAGTEPKLAVVLATYAAIQPVHIVETSSTVTDLGAVAAAPCRASLSRSQTG